MKKAVVAGIVIVLAVGAFAVGAVYAKDYVANKQSQTTSMNSQNVTVNPNSTVWTNNGTTGTGD